MTALGPRLIYLTIDFGGYDSLARVNFGARRVGIV